MTTTALAPARAAAPAVRTGRAALPSLVGIEIRKSLSTRSGTALAVSSVLLAPAAMAIAAASGESIPFAAGPIGVMGMATALVLLSVGVLSTAGEWTHRTVQTTFMLVPHRGRVLAAKVAAVALLGAVLAAVAAALSTSVLALMLGDQLSWDGAGRALTTVVAAGAVFAVTGAGAGAALANAPAALTGLYLVLLGVIPVLSQFQPGIGSSLDPSHAVMALAQGQDETKSVLVLAGWMVVTSVAGWILTHRRAVQ